MTKYLKISQDLMHNERTSIAVEVLLMANDKTDNKLNLEVLVSKSYVSLVKIKGPRKYVVEFINAISSCELSKVFNFRVIKKWEVMYVC